MVQYFITIIRVSAKLPLELAFGARQAHAGLALLHRAVPNGTNSTANLGVGGMVPTWYHRNRWRKEFICGFKLIQMVVIWNQTGFTFETSRTASLKNKCNDSMKLTSTKHQINPEQLDNLIPKLKSQLLSNPVNAFGNPRPIYYSILI